MIFSLAVPALVGGLAAAMGSFAGRAMIALGVGFVTYKGIDVSVGMMKDSVLAGVRGLPVDALNLVGYLWIDKALTVIISAISAAMTMKAIGGSVKKAVFK